MQALDNIQDANGGSILPVGLGASARERLVTGSLYSFMAILAAQGLALLTAIITARLLGPESLGLLVIYTQFASLAVGIASAGLSVPVTKFTAQMRVQDKGRLARFLSTVLVIAIVVAIATSGVFWIAAAPIGWSLYGGQEMVLMIQLMATFLVLNALAAFGSAVLQGLQELRALSMLGIFIEALGVPLLFIFLSRFGILGAVISGIVVLSVGTSLTFGLACVKLRREGIRIALAVELESVRQFLLFTAPLLASGVVLLVATVAQNSYIAFRLGLVDVGLFKVALTLYRVILFIPSAMSVPLLPVASEMFARQSRSRIQTQVTSILRVSCFIGTPLALVLGFGSGVIIGLLYGNTYVDAAPLAFLLTMAGFAEIVNVVAMNSVLGQGRTWLLLAVDVTQAAVLLGGTFLFVGAFGLLGVGMAMFVNSALYGAILLGVLALNRHVLLWSALKPMTVTALTFIIAFPVFFLASDATRGFLGLAIALGYSIASWSLMHESERDFFRGMVRNAFRWIHA